MENLKKFLGKYRANSKEFTHTGVRELLGKYNIPGEKLEKFYKIYSKTLSTDIPGITEVVPDISPLRFDLDFRFKLTDITRQYDAKDIDILIKTINQGINKYLNIKKDLIQGFVLEKEKPKIKDGKVCDGIHIIYPDIYLNIASQYAIHKFVIKEFKEQKYWDHINSVNSIDDIFDTDVILKKTPWTMYGGNVKESKLVYKLAHVYDEESDELEFKGRYADKVLVALFSVRRSVKPIQVKNEKLEYISTLIVEPKEMDEKTEIKAIRKDGVDLDYIKNLVNLLSTERAEKYRTWAEVGWCLFNIDKSHLMDAWYEFSQKSGKQNKFSRSDCKKEWKKFKDGSLSIGSLCFWAKRDNPAGYKELYKETIQAYKTRALSRTHHDVAILIKRLFEHEYVCSSLVNKTWYQYRNHRWEEVQIGFPIRKYISKGLPKEYIELKEYLYEKREALLKELSEAKDEKNNDEKITSLKTSLKKITVKLENVEKLIEKFKTVPFKDNVLRECCELFYQKDFEDKIDGNPGLLGFENGVFDLDKNEFRDGCPDDLITFSTKIDYVEYKQDAKETEEVESFLKQILPNKEVRKYVKLLFSTYLSGYNREEKFHILTGTGSNGKSKLVELFEITLGDYCHKFPITLLTSKRAASNAATPELAGTRGKRLGTLQEPDESARINVGFMKELTGRDMIYARPLYKEPIKFRPQFKLLLMCNHMPDIPSDDGGTWRRIRVIKFTSKFVDDPQAENEYKIDRKLSEKMEYWKSAFVFILLKNYQQYLKEGMKEPEVVMKYSLEYQRSSDIYGQFVDDKLKPTKKGGTKLKELYFNFRAWYVECNLNGKCPSMKDFKGYMERNHGVMNKRYGWRFELQEDDKLEDSDDEE